MERSLGEQIAELERELNMTDSERVRHTAEHVTHLRD